MLRESKNKLLICGLVLFLIFSANIQAKAQTSPLWGDLKKGAFAVGFSSSRNLDHARATRPRTNFDGTIFTGERARIVDVYLWYPAASAITKTTPPPVKMFYEDYLFSAPQYDAQAPTGEQKKRIRDNFVAQNGGTRQAEELLKMQVEAFKNAAPAGGKFPLIVGVHISRTLAEYLASHGYTVALVSSPSASENTLIDYVGDLEFALNRLSGNSQVDFSSIGATGFSASAGVASLFQMKTGNVGAVVSFDGTEGWNQWREQIMRESYFRPEAASVPYLRFHDTGHSAPDINFSYFYDRAQFMELVRVDYKTFGHRDMENAIFDRLIPNETAKGDFLQYQKLLGEYTLNFFDAHLKKKPEGADFLKRSPEENNFASGFVSVTRKNASPRPPSRVEITEIIDRDGIEAFLKTNQNLKKSLPQPFAEPLLRSLLLIYNRQRRHDAAVGLATILLENYPELSTTYYFAGIAHKDAKQIERAIKNFEKFLEVEKIDNVTSLSTKERLRELVLQNLKELKNVK